ncbi:MAG: primosomal protein N' [Bacteroidota bacterium]
MNTIVEVILPLPVKSNFHYKVPEILRDQVAVGKRVLVSFGKRKIYTGLIRKVEELPTEEEGAKLKYLEEILDPEPSFQEAQLALFDWIAYYYSCTAGEVFKAALPVGLKPESALKVEMTPGLNWTDFELNDKEFLLMEALDIQPVLNFKEISDIWSVANPNPRLKTMEARGLIKVYQEVEDKYKPKYKSYLRLADAYMDEEKMHEALDSITRSESQENLLMRIIAAYHKGNLVPKTDIQKELEIGSQVASALIKKGFVLEEKVQVDRLELYGYSPKPSDIILNPDQDRALGEIKGYLQETPLKPVLLHGVTGSGKTHIYIELIKEALAEGKQVLYLLPEITLTKQIIDRLKSEFGENVGVYHSRFNDHERVEIWQKVRKREYQLVVGVRSAIFLPFQELGLIVVDEEHDTSFKQFEPAPRYNARDVSVYYAFANTCPVILGSATPAFESYNNALEGKYHLVELKKRAVARFMPEIEIVDMRVQRKKKLTNGIFSSVLEKKIGETLERNEQVILFQNRRGYSPYLVCETCGHVPQCINCDISMTYHKERKHLRCHYCGHTELNTQKCENCGNYTLRRVGIGTEKIKESVEEVFPNHVVERMDLDTTRSKSGYRNLINKFENRQIDILVGTQMVSKGLDFDNVTLVGVILADNLLTFPDFRAYEHAYQLLTQVSGRAGRSTKKGHVIVQSFMPDNLVLGAIENEYEKFYNQEIIGRQQMGYPPFSRIIRIEIRHKDMRFVERESLRLHGLLKPFFGVNLLGPDFALVPRVRNTYRMQFMIKVSKKLGTKQLRDILFNTIDTYYQMAPAKSLRIIIDVDPA